MISGYDFFVVHMPLRLHFQTPTYDVFKYGGRSNAISYESFLKRNDTKLFESWAKRAKDKDTAGKICLANEVYGTPNWIHDTISDGMAVHEQWKKIRSSMKTVFAEDMQTCKDVISAGKIANWEGMINKTPSGNKPPLMQLALTGKVTTETMCILDRINDDKILIRWKCLYENDPLVRSWITRVEKYKPFCYNVSTVSYSDKFSEVIQK